MSYRPKRNTVYYLVTRSSIYRTDDILRQIDQWFEAFRTGQLIRAPSADQEALDEFEAHLEQTLLESEQLAKQEAFDF